MRRWATRVALILILFGAAIAALVAIDAGDSPSLSGNMKQEDLPIIKSGWQGNPTDQKGRFMNDELPYLPRLVDVIKWKLLQGNQFRYAKASDTRRVEVRDPSAFLASNDDGIMWMGHASFFIRIDGVSIVTDPVFGEPPFLKRFVPVPLPLDSIKNIDLILISHDHRDHLDEATIKDITAKFPDATIVAGLRSEDVLRDWAPSNQIRTIGWFQQLTEVKGIRISFVPTRHWSRRGLADTNWRLWGAFVIEGSKQKIYFGGDSGYGRHYGEVGEMFPNIDFFLVGIGAYEPRWFMEPNHNTPAEALKGFQDAGAKTLIPMHYGTFDLSDEPPSAPLETLLKEADLNGVREHMKPLAIYESIPLEH